MTDDELDRALFALPLESRRRSARPDPGRDRAAPAPTFRAWEICLLVAAVALVGSATTGSSKRRPCRLEPRDMIVAGARGLGLFSRSTYVCSPSHLVGLVDF